jgi:hypothetical protein
MRECTIINANMDGLEKAAETGGIYVESMERVQNLVTSSKANH